MQAVKNFILKIGKPVFFLFQLMCYLLIYFLLLYNSFNYLDPDFGWHLKIGQDIYQNQQVPRIEIYNFPILGQTWVDHEWLANLLIYIIYENFGYIAVSLGFALLIMIVLLLQNFLVKKYICSKKTTIFLLLLLQLFGVYASRGLFGIRVQEVALLFILLLIWIYFEVERQGQIRYLLFLPLLFYCWSQLHGSFMIGLVLLWIWFFSRNLLVMWAKKRRNRIAYMINLTFFTPISTSKKQNRFFLIMIIASNIIVLFGPYGIELINFLTNYSNTFYMNHIMEWLSPFSLLTDIYSILYLLLGLSFYYFYFMFFYVNKKPVQKVDGFMFMAGLVLFILAYRSTRHLPIFFLFSSFLFIEFFSKFKLKFIEKLLIFNYKSQVALNLFGLLISVVFFIIIESLFTLTYFNKNPFQSYCENYPCYALKYLREKKITHLKTLNVYMWGGYMLHEQPNTPIFIDGRLPIKKFKDKSFLEEYYRAFSPDSFNQAAYEYGFDLILIKSWSDKKNQSNMILEILKKILRKIYDAEREKQELKKTITENRNYGLIYTDDVSIVFIRQN
ncbi:MAG: hypothetical protein GF332_02695 [Candidatus Moranbacteria bacterium]|nr:hypothetical protein [Candidatus Moranbacteria bacterium]